MAVKFRVIFLGVVVSLVTGCATTSQTPAAPQQHVRSTTSDDMMYEVVARPLSLLSTIGGSAMYVVTLPFSTASGSDQEAECLLVDKPYEGTFNPKMGDFQRLKEIKDRE